LYVQDLVYFATMRVPLLKISQSSRTLVFKD
jgi:hypothetical protein